MKRQIKMEDLTKKSERELIGLVHWISGEFNINPFASQEMLLQKELILNEFQRRGKAKKFYDIFDKGLK